ncbi:hypothetical protein [Nocardia sp. BMG51109]|uniref:hypothetical protein n=1 Tax=Nocardia sp. BMG51109 TaxID=1056816 RepID=UPI000463240B|nr:hypothetical protein [Nocardia sp. BMG51109]
MGSAELDPGWFDAKAQDDPAWLRWRNPDRIAAQIDLLFTETFATVPVGEVGWWVAQGYSRAPINGDADAYADIIPPMPGADRYSDAMLHWIEGVFDWFFPDETSMYDPGNAELVDRFACWIGETFVRRAGGVWFNGGYDSPISGLFGGTFAPKVGYHYDAPADDISDRLFLSVEDEDVPDFSRVTDEIYSRAIDYAEAYDLPHEGRELRNIARSTEG